MDTQYGVSTICLKQDEQLIRSVLMQHINVEPLMTIQQLSITHVAQVDSVRVTADIFSMQKNDAYLNELVTQLSQTPGISEATWQRLS